MPVSLTCPSCGGLISLHTRSPQVVVCPACNMTSLVVNDSLDQIGKMAVLTDVPSIFEVNKTYLHKDWRFTPCGRVRYDYGQGYWDEWFVRDLSGKENWVSVDEGDIAIEKPFQTNLSDILPFEEIKIGSQLKVGKIEMTVVEKNTCTMIGAEGELPFKLEPNDTYNYIDLLGPNRSSFTIEYESDGINCYKGFWIDPFDIKKA